MLRKTTYIISIILIISCGVKNTSTESNEVNTEVNSKYKKSRKSYSGNYNDTEYKELIKKLRVELKNNLPKNKTILINFTQKASNCISARFSEADNLQVSKNRLRNSNRISSKNNTIDFFIYTKDAFNKNLYKRINEYILDSGFFYKNIFTEHKNCEAFLIIKPNGDFYKYYGEDYFSEVEKFLKRN